MDDMETVQPNQRDMRNVDPNAGIEQAEKKPEEMSDEEIKRRVQMMLSGKKEDIQEDMEKNPHKYSSAEREHLTKFHGMEEDSTKGMKSYDHNNVKKQVRDELF